MAKADPFHEGERIVQERSGEREAALRNGVMVGEMIPTRAIPFLAGQRMLVVGSMDEWGEVWASMVFGATGFATSPDGRWVILDRSRIRESRADPLWSNLRAGLDVGLLAIELSTRRRLRINGVVSGVTEQRIEVSVREAYPNCPKYIQRRRDHQDGGTPDDMEPEVSGMSLDAARSRLIAGADTVFVASRHPVRGLDVSHRGGAPGFVRIMEPRRLRIPDYRGNSMFNTLGNFMVDNRAGMIFPDFDRGRHLQLTGTVAVHFDMQEDPGQPAGGTGRYWDFNITRWLEWPMAKRVAWELLEFSPYNPSTQ